MGNNGKNSVMADDVERVVAVKAIEGNLPYEKTLYVNHIRVLLKQTAESLIIIGKMLLVMKEKEGHGDYMTIVEDEVGIPYKTAQRFMNAARKASNYPQIGFSKMDKLSNLYALLEAPEEDLKDLEENGVLAGRTINELEVMSVKEMRNLIRKLKDKGEKVIGKQVSKLEAKNTDLQKEMEKLKMQLRRMDHTTDTYLQSWQAAEALIDEGINILNSLDHTEAIEDTKTRQKYLIKAKTIKRKVDGFQAILSEKLS